MGGKSLDLINLIQCNSIFEDCNQRNTMYFCLVKAIANYGYLWLFCSLISYRNIFFANATGAMK